MINGQCLCGSVQYSVRGPFEYAGYCHCRRCRLVSGSAFSAFAAARTEYVSIDKGRECVSVYERNADNFSHFCHQCGSVLYAVVRNGEYAHVQMGTLSDDPGIRPQCHIFVGSKAPWHQIADDLPQYVGLPEQPD